jgi:hypothetical protein
MWLRIIIWLVLGTLALTFLRWQKIFYLSIENLKWLVLLLVVVAAMMFLGSLTGAF